MEPSSSISIADPFGTAGGHASQYRNTERQTKGYQAPWRRICFAPQTMQIVALVENLREP